MKTDKHRISFYTSQLTGSTTYQQPNVEKPWHVRRFLSTARLVNSLKPEEILDIGAGAGEILDLIECPRKYALEINQEWVKELQKKGVKAMVGDIMDSGLPDRSFDLVMATEILEHFPYYDLRLVLSEIERITKRYFVCSVPNPVSLYGRIAGLFGYYYGHTNTGEHAFMADLSGWKKLLGEYFALEQAIGVSMIVPVPDIIRKTLRLPTIMLAPLKTTLADRFLFLCRKREPLPAKSKRVSQQ